MSKGGRRCFTSFSFGWIKSLKIEFLQDGLQFLSYLREQIQSNKGITADEAHEKLKFHLCCGESIPKDPLRMFARLLSHNSTLVDEEWKNDMQGHWNVSKAVAKETHISFFVPCLRLRFR